MSLIVAWVFGNSAPITRANDCPDSAIQTHASSVRGIPWYIVIKIRVIKGEPKLTYSIGCLFGEANHADQGSWDYLVQRIRRLRVAVPRFFAEHGNFPEKHDGGTVTIAQRRYQRLRSVGIVIA